MVGVKLKVLTVEEANEHWLKEEEQHICREKDAALEPSVKEEITQLKVLLLHSK